MLCLHTGFDLRLEDVFGWQRAQQLFVVELGSEKLTALIGAAFHKTTFSATQRTHTMPPGNECVAFFSQSDETMKFVTHAFEAASFHELDIIVRLPYAYVEIQISCA